MRVGIIHRPGATSGGDWIAANNYAYELRNLGMDVNLIPADDFQSFLSCDFLHLYAACSPDWGLPAAREVKRLGKPLIVSPFWWPRDERQAYYGYAGKDLVRGYTEAVAKTLSLADVLFTVTMSEAVECWKLVPRVNVKVIGIGCANPPIMEDVERHDVVVSIGRIEPHKNQLMTVRAAKRLGFPVILAGEIANPEYWEVIQREGWDVKHFIPNEKQKWLLLAGSRVHALPSFFENPGLVHSEAALTFTPSVMGGHGCEPEFFGEYGIYCDPTDLDDITEAIAEAWDRETAWWAEIPEWRDVAWSGYSWMVYHGQ